jgi:uncharacterized protein YhaN
MRIERLRLLRYGALTNRTLEFRPGAGIHIVYGPNEAGKSSALCALSDLLFGFEHARNFDFLHEAASLRIGASLRARDGGALAFRRRRGARNTLLADADDEEALREDALAPFLGGLTRPVFERAFGLDPARLRRGADEMLSANGEMGAMLFAASSGVLGLSKVRAGLDEEAAAIFTPRRSASRAFYQLLDRHEEARRAEREQELRAGDWKTLNESIATRQEAYDAKARERAENRKRQSEIESRLTLAPVLAEIDAKAAALEGFRDLDAMPAGFGQKLALALGEAAAADAALQRAKAAQERAGRDLDRITLHQGLLDRTQSIVDLFEQRGADQKARADLPRIAAERDEYRARLADLARRLGIAPVDLDRAHPSDAVLARVGEALARAEKAQAKVADLEDRLAEERQTLERLDADRRALPPLDPRPWRDRLAALAPDLKRLDERETARASLVAERRRIAETAARLDPPVDDPGHLAAAPLPSAQDLVVHRKAMAAAARQIETLDKSLEEEREKLRRLEAEIAAHEDSALPTDAAIARARDSRDRAFGELADAIRGRAPLDPQGAAAAIERVGALTRTADVLADAAIREADRVSAHAARLTEHARLAQTMAAATADLAAARDALAAARQSYEAPFSRLAVAPRDPDRMIVWLQEVARLLQARGEADREAERLDALGPAACARGPRRRSRPRWRRDAARAGADARHFRTAARGRSRLGGQPRERSEPARMRAPAGAAGSRSRRGAASARSRRGGAARGCAGDRACGGRAGARDRRRPCRLEGRAPPQVRGTESPSPRAGHGARHRRLRDEGRRARDGGRA